MSEGEEDGDGGGVGDVGQTFEPGVGRGWGMKRRRKLELVKAGMVEEGTSS